MIRLATIANINAMCPETAIVVTLYLTWNLCDFRHRTEQISGHEADTAYNRSHTSHSNSLSDRALALGVLLRSRTPTPAASAVPLTS